MYTVGDLGESLRRCRPEEHSSCLNARSGIRPIHDYNFLVGGDHYLHVDILAGYDIGSWCNCRDRLHGNQKRWLAVGLVSVGYPNCRAGDLVFHDYIKEKPQHVSQRQGAACLGATGFSGPPQAD